MAGGGRRGPVVIPDPDDDNAGRLLDNAGSRNMNNDDNNDAPPPPPKKTAATLRRRKGAGTTMVPDNDVMAAVVSRDAVATNAANAVGRRGARDLCAVADDMGGFMLMCLVSYDCRTTIVYGMDCMVSCAFQQISADICRYLHTPADSCTKLN
jgi:hypothetical protein